MLLTILIIAGSFPVGEAITNDLSPATLMFVRFILAALLFAPYIFIKHKLHSPTRRQFTNYAILSIPLVVFFWCMFESLRYTSALNTGALYTLVPAITAIYALFINGEITNRFRSFGLIVGTIGALWIVFRGDYVALMGLDLNYGDFIFLLGCFLFGLYNPLIKKLYSGEPMEVMTFWILLFSAFWFLIISGKDVLQVNWFSISNNVYHGILYLTIFATLLSFYFLQLAIVKIGATKVAAYSFLTPLFVILINISFGLGEFELATLPGIILVIAAMFIIQKESKPLP